MRAITTPRMLYQRCLHRAGHTVDGPIDGGRVDQVVAVEADGRLSDVLDDLYWEMGVGELDPPSREVDDDTHRDRLRLFINPCFQVCRRRRALTRQRQPSGRFSRLCGR